jgi:beta-lactamase class A
MRAAITESDNAAAESVWEQLGDPTTAAQKVEQILQDSGDPTTVESRKLRPEFTAEQATRRLRSITSLLLPSLA